MWMWLTGVFGIATKYSEALLSVKYRVKMPDGTMAGGPMYVLERGLNMKWLAVLFAAFTSVTAFGIGNMVQANSISTLVLEAFQIPLWVTGLVLTILTAVVIIGGIKSIANVCERLVPFMAITYVPVSYTHLRAHETVLDLVCRLLLEKKHLYTSPSPPDRTRTRMPSFS